MLRLDKNVVSLYCKIVSSEHPWAPVEASLLILVMPNTCLLSYFYHLLP